MKSQVPDSDYVLRNREAWDAEAAAYAAKAPRQWSSEPTWGIFGIPEAEVRLLPEVNGLDTLELGCGTAYVSAWLARRGARPVGIDNSPAQLETARQMQHRFQVHFPLYLGNAESVPLPDASFDLCISEYGASIWCDPYRWIPEANRLLRPGGHLIFLLNSCLSMLCAPELATEKTGPILRRPFFGLHRLEWPDEPGVEFHLGHGDWIRLFNRTGFEIEDLLELRPGEDAATSYDYMPLEWARKWPCEEVWKVRKR